MKTLSDVWWSVVWQVPSYFRRFRCHEIVGIGTRRDATKRREQKNGRRYYLQILCAPVARSLSLSLSLSLTLEMSYVLLLLSPPNYLHRPANNFLCLESP